MEHRHKRVHVSFPIKGHVSSKQKKHNFKKIGKSFSDETKMLGIFCSSTTTKYFFSKNIFISIAVTSGSIAVTSGLGVGVPAVSDLQVELVLLVAAEVRVRHEVKGVRITAGPAERRCQKILICGQRLSARVARWFIFRPKIPIGVNV
jgi:hypothetical protein